MAGSSWWRRALVRSLSIGDDPRDSETKRGGRRVMLAAIYIATIMSIPAAFADLDQGHTAVAVMSFATTLYVPVMAVAIAMRPSLFGPLVTALFAAVIVSGVVESTLFGGLIQSGLVAVFGLDVAMGALVGFGLRAALWWCGAFVASVLYAAAISGHVEPTYVLSDPTGDAVFNLVTTGILTIAVLSYFVRQRDRFQRQSDDLLHNILPVEIADRLKGERAMIADDFPAASVLFADVVGFTPMSARMSPAELVGLLNEVFTRFDRFVDELGLEKIKTVGDEYMVAAGVPTPRPDHAHAVADLALRIRDDVAANAVDGHRLSLRIGINSGPVTAGIIGTHKFAYDLWGDTVNTASRMESEGVPGSIQVSDATHELIKDDFHCELRGPIAVKGKELMTTWFLVSRNGA